MSQWGFLVGLLVSRWLVVATFLLTVPHEGCRLLGYSRRVDAFQLHAVPFILWLYDDLLEVSDSLTVAVGHINASEGRGVIGRLRHIVPPCDNPVLEPDFWCFTLNFQRSLLIWEWEYYTRLKAGVNIVGEQTDSEVSVWIKYDTMGI